MFFCRVSVVTEWCGDVSWQLTSWNRCRSRRPCRTPLRPVHDSHCLKLVTTTTPTPSTLTARRNVFSSTSVSVLSTPSTSRLLLNLLSDLLSTFLSPHSSFLQAVLYRPTTYFQSTSCLADPAVTLPWPHLILWCVVPKPFDTYYTSPEADTAT